MAITIDELIPHIASFVVGPDEVEGEIELRLYELLHGIDLLPGRESAVEPLFQLLERNADSELGNPGPVVHALEAIPGYEPKLIASLHRHPTYYTVWMVNRILNTELSAHDRAAWLGELRAAASHALADASVVESVEHFLTHQAASESLE